MASTIVAKAQLTQFFRIYYMQYMIILSTHVKVNILYSMSFFSSTVISRESDPLLYNPAGLYCCHCRIKANEEDCIVILLKSITAPLARRPEEWKKESRVGEWEFLSKWDCLCVDAACATRLHLCFSSRCFDTRSVMVLKTLSARRRWCEQQADVMENY